MRQQAQTKRSNRSIRHALRVGCAALALQLSVTTGCDDDVFDEFRSAAANSLENGVKQILDGIVEGAFAAFVVGTDSSGNTSSGSSGSTSTQTDTGTDTGAGTDGGAVTPG